MLNASAALYLSSLEVKFVGSIPEKQPNCEGIELKTEVPSVGLGLLPCTIAVKAYLLGLLSNQRPCSEAHLPACPFLSNSQHTPLDYWYAYSDWRSRTDFQVSSSHYLCSKLSSCICINFLFPKVSSMYFKAAQLLFHIFQGTGVFNVMWGQHYTMDLWQGHTEMNTVCEQTLNGSLNYRVWLCCF